MSYTTVTNLHEGGHKRTRITFSLDLEDNLVRHGLEPRYSALTHKVLEFLEESNISGTFFVVGELARQNTGLIQKISNHGHEIAYHSRSHVPLTQEIPERFRRETRSDKAFLEDITGRRITGFRAPIWSLVPSSVWAIDILVELGFKYSSSVLPAANPLYGFSGAPAGPFRWHNGLLELPLPLARIGPITLPLLGGIYFRYLFVSMQEFILKRIDPSAVLWTYCHPYDFDPEQPFTIPDDLNLPMSFLLWANRRGTFRKMRKLLNFGTAPNFESRIRCGEFDIDLPTFEPQFADLSRKA